MLVYTFDHTLDGLLSAVYDAYAQHQQPDELVAEGAVLPMFTDEVRPVVTADDKARRVWAGLEKRLSREWLRAISISWLSGEAALHTPLFHYIYKVFQQQGDLSRNFADADVLYVYNTSRRVAHEALRMKQFVRFQKAKDGTYLGVVSPDNDVLPLVVDHFHDRFRDQPWLLYDARRRYGYYHQATDEAAPPLRITFADEAALPFSLTDGKLTDELLSADDRLMQDLWRTYFKAICIRERLNPRKQLNDMPRRYWKYMTEKQ